ncbi:hypothetical protein [Roseateles sp.]|jgi:hypothetical protein|uniref:hypothetical protein n=1 Tax=Roseateles sp. TaxID=1971397 RepID=UPI0031D23C6D
MHFAQRADAKRAAAAREKVTPGMKPAARDVMSAGTAASRSRASGHVDPLQFGGPSKMRLESAFCWQTLRVDSEVESGYSASKASPSSRTPSAI